MGIHQFSIGFDERQDRLLWRVSTQEAQEFQFWLTRRLVSRLVPALSTVVQGLDAQQPGTVASDPPARQMVSELRHQHIVEQADFQTPYTPPPQRPLGPEPMLLTDVHMSPAGPNVQWLLRDQSAGSARQCQMTLTAELVHAWLHLVQQALEKADWRLPGHVASEPTSPPTGPSAYRY